MLQLYYKSLTRDDIEHGVKLQPLEAARSLNSLKEFLAFDDKEQQWELFVAKTDGVYRLKWRRWADFIAENKLLMLDKIILFKDYESSSIRLKIKQWENQLISLKRVGENDTKALKLKFTALHAFFEHDYGEGIDVEDEATGLWSLTTAASNEGTNLILKNWGGFRKAFNVKEKDHIQLSHDRIRFKFYILRWPHHAV